MECVVKDFGATRALDGVSFDLKRGEAHALLGENGAGKSTLIKILSGAIKADGGAMFLDGRLYTPAGPPDSRRSGISVIYQELTLAPHLSVEDNIMLGREEHRRGWLRRRAMRERVRRALSLVHHGEIGLDTPVLQLGVAARQIVEIARALAEEAKILIMDEPTSSLSGEDARRLFEIIGSLKARGVGIIYISHFLEEVQQVADRFTVLRDGKLAGGGVIASSSLDDIIRLMVGGEVKELFPRDGHAVGETAIEVRALKGRKMSSPVDLVLRAGEIVGVAGLIGSGRTEFLRTIFGLDRLEAGSVRSAKFGALRGGPGSRIAAGLGYLSEDRQGEGLALGRSIVDNLTLSRFGPFVRFGWLSLKRQRQAGWDWIRRMNIKARSPLQEVGHLSGGNQQKVALARLLHQDADVFLMDEPTRGIDIGSKSQIYEWMSELAKAGKSVLFVSSYFPELLGVCDRIAVFHRGQLVESRPSCRWTEESLMATATTGRPAAEP
jgi:ribose transport system ATP-binding protein